MQKTAYDLRISDWSSDVCSSDLLVERLGGGDEHRFGVAILHALRIAIGGEAHRGAIRAGDGGDSFDDLEQQAKAVLGAAAVAIGAEIGAVAQELVDQIAVRGVELDTVEPGGKRVRSEEHTSELQSLMRISYAVFCLKKKNQINLREHTTDTT